jgi:hypothetical protein
MFRRDLNQTDWVGDALLTIVFGVAAVVSVYLPWANFGTHGDVNFSLSRPDGVNTALQTAYGAPALWLGIAVIVLGGAMAVLGPRRLRFWPGLVTIAAATAMLVDCAFVAHAIAEPLRAGLGLFVLTLVCVLLIPIGFASAAVGFLVGGNQRRAARAAAAAAATACPSESAD